MKSSKNISNFFKVETVQCPACGIYISKSKLNSHLDSDCSSAPPDNKNCKDEGIKFYPCTYKNVPPEICSKPNNKKQMTSKSSSKNSFQRSRLSLKQQRINFRKLDIESKANLSQNQKFISETEVVTLDDDSSLSANNYDNESCFKKELNIEKLNTGSNASFSQNQKIETNIVTLDGNSSLSAYIYENENSVEKEPSRENIPLKLSKAESTEVINLEDEPSCDKNVEREESPKSFVTDINKTITVTKADCSTPEPVRYEIPKSISSENVPPCLESYSGISKNNSNTMPVHPQKSEQEETTNNLPESNDAIAVLNDAEASLEADNEVFGENLENNLSSESYSPYYIANFKHILNNVLQDEFNKVLFNDEDMHFINEFEGLSDSGQKLYVRLFQRKYNWLKLSKINYPNITKDPVKILEELVSAGLVDSGLDMIDLETALDLLSLPEARNVAKQFNFNSSGKNKADISNMLLKHCKEHKSVFFCNGRNSVSNAMLKKVKQILGHCYRVSLLPKRLFTRILMLFSLPTMSEDDDDAAGGQQQQLLTLLQVNKGEITFPDYKINRQTMIFIERDELIRYEEAKQLENDIMNAVENKNFDLAKELFIEAKKEFENQLLSSFVERAASLPTYLKKFTSFHIYVRCMTQGVEILQRLRQYKEAVDLLRRLLDQKVFCQDYRGRWWDRMALNLEQHLKQRQQALEAIKKSIRDKHVRVGYRYSLLTRALRILKKADESDDLKNEILEASNVIEAPKVLIRGQLFPRNVLGRRNVFISSSKSLSEEEDITVLGVEQLAIEHYKSEGYTEGIHGESSTFHFMYGLLFWDIIYDGDIPDAFISPYQTHPLDLNHDSFFIRREKQIMNHLKSLRASTIEEIKEIIKSTWEAHFGQTSIVMWDRFTDLDHALGLVSCMPLTMWWQLFTVLVAISAVSADDSEEGPNCMSLLHSECEDEHDKKPDDFPGNEEELEEFCKYSLKYFDCSDRVFSGCNGEDSSFGRYMNEMGALARRICIEDPLLRTAIATILPCFKENLAEVQSCDAGFFEDEDAFSDAVNEITSVGTSEDSRSRACLHLLYGIGCTAATIGLECGDVAKDIVLTLVQAFETPFQICPAGVKEKVPEIVEVMQIEAEKARSVEETLKRKK